LYILNQLDDDAITYNMPVAVIINGEIDNNK